MNKLNQKRKGKRGRSHKPSVYSQFGYESSGLSNLLSQQQAVARKASLKNQLENNFRDMVKSYLKHDAKQMISEHQIIFDR